MPWVGAKSAGCVGNVAAIGIEAIPGRDPVDVGGNAAVVGTVVQGRFHVLGTEEGGNHDLHFFKRRLTGSRIAIGVAVVADGCATICEEQVVDVGVGVIDVRSRRCDEGGLIAFKTAFTITDVETSGRGVHEVQPVGWVRVAIVIAVDDIADAVTVGIGGEPWLRDEGDTVGVYFHFDWVTSVRVNIVGDKVSNQAVSIGGAGEDAGAFGGRVGGTDDDLTEHVIEHVGWFVDSELGCIAEVFRGSAFLGCEGIEDHSHEGEEPEECDDDDERRAATVGRCWV